MRSMPNRQFDAADTAWPVSDFDFQALQALQAAADYIDACVFRLQCAGFAAEVRSFSLEIGVVRRTVAVYVHGLDARISWTTAGPDSRPAMLPFRSEGRHGHAFTLFSGDRPDDVDAFERMLMQRRAADTLSVVARTPVEWDPHVLSTRDDAWVAEHVNQVLALVESVLPAPRTVDSPRRGFSRG